MSEEEKTKKSCKIQTLYAHHLFNNKKFKEAMEQFLKLGTDPYEVIRLFPDMILQPSNINESAETVTGMAKLQGRDLESGLLALIGFLTEVRHKLSGDSNSKDKKEKNEVDQRSKTMTAVATEQLLKIIDTTLLKCYLQVGID